MPEICLSNEFPGGADAARPLSPGRQPGSRATEPGVGRAVKRREMSRSPREDGFQKKVKAGEAGTLGNRREEICRYGSIVERGCFGD